MNIRRWWENDDMPLLRVMAHLVLAWIVWLAYPPIAQAVSDGITPLMVIGLATFYGLGLSGMLLDGISLRGMRGTITALVGAPLFALAGMVVLAPFLLAIGLAAEAIFAIDAGVVMLLLLILLVVAIIVSGVRRWVSPAGTR